MGVAIVSIVALLQILAIRSSNAMSSKSTARHLARNIDSQALSKKINKLGIHIMLVLLFYTTPFLTIDFKKSNIRELLGRNLKSVLEFIFGYLYGSSLRKLSGKRNFVSTIEYASFAGLSKEITSSISKTLFSTIRTSTMIFQCFD